MSDLWKIEEPMPAPKPVHLGDKPARYMTIREEFVRFAMATAIESGREFSDAKQRAAWAVEIADAHIAALEGSAGK